MNLNKDDLSTKVDSDGLRYRMCRSSKKQKLNFNKKVMLSELGTCSNLFNLFSNSLGSGEPPHKKLLTNQQETKFASKANIDLDYSSITKPVEKNEHNEMKINAQKKIIIEEEDEPDTEVKKNILSTVQDKILLDNVKIKHTPANIDAKQFDEDNYRIPFTKREILEGELMKYSKLVKQSKNSIAAHSEKFDIKLMELLLSPDLWNYRSIIHTLRNLDLTEPIEYWKYSNETRLINGEKILIDLSIKVIKLIEKLLHAEGLSLSSYMYYYVGIQVFKVLLTNALSIMESKVQAIAERITYKITNATNITLVSELLGMKIFSRYYQSLSLLTKELKPSLSDREKINSEFVPVIESTKGITEFHIAKPNIMKFEDIKDLLTVSSASDLSFNQEYDRLKEEVTYMTYIIVLYCTRKRELKVCQNSTSKTSS